VAVIPLDLTARQLRIDELAIEVFAAAAWLGPLPPVIVDPTLTRYTRARATIRTGRQRIRIHPRVLDEPEQVQRGTLAHEIAHLVEGQATGWPVALLATVLLWAAAITVAALAMLEHDTTATTIRFMIAIGLACLAWRVAVIPQRRCELRADRQSVAYVGRDAVLQTLAHLKTETPALLQLIAASGLETHPCPAQRIRHIAKH
jgi:Zn-dependent protease with chaperone function